MREFYVEVLWLYLVITATTGVLSLIGWGIMYLVSTDTYGESKSDALRSARTCLAMFITCWAWPYYTVRAIARAVRTTLKEGAPE